LTPSRAPWYRGVDALRMHAADAGTRDRPYLRFEDRQWSFADTYREACRYAQMFLAERVADRPFHIGLLLENRPEFVFAQLGAFLAGAAVVGLNPTRRGPHQARDITHADCQLVVSETKFVPLLGDAYRDIPAPPTFVATRWGEAPDERHGTRLLEDALGPHAPVDPQVPIGFDDLALIIFTSGTTAAPKGVMRAHGRLLLFGFGAVMNMTHATPDDVVYCCMPLFHSNAQILGLSMTLAVGCSLALARRFSKSRFLDDVRRHGATLFNYVGSPLAYVLDTPERPDDSDNPLRLAFGNEGPRQYLDVFARRFDCRVVDSYGASEVGVSFTREDGDPPGCLGRAAPEVIIMNEHGGECPAAELDASGRLANPDAAIGEIVNTGGPGFFEGYYKNDAATQERIRGGHFHTGDLGYRDAAGYIYFAGRDAEWLRVDGENFLARPIEDILQRHPDVFLPAVYAVPDAQSGDRVMAALLLRPGKTFDPTAFARFLDEQSDLSPKWRPTYVRIVLELQRTETNKVQKRTLQREKFLDVDGPDPIFWFRRDGTTFERFTRADLAALRDRFVAAGNLARWEL
jgi:fatty-acyl-CoA synthase